MLRESACEYFDRNAISGGRHICGWIKRKKKKAVKAQIEMATSPAGQRVRVNEYNNDIIQSRGIDLKLRSSKRSYPPTLGSRPPARP